MADQQHLSILREGVEHWNKWRKRNRDIVPNLNNANLRGFDLSHANMRDVGLGMADLSEANLSHADFSGAYLYYANLHSSEIFHSDFSNAELFHVDLSDAIISESNLKGAVLMESFISGALIYDSNLSDVELGNASLSRAKFQNVNLSNASLSHCNFSLCGFDKVDFSKSIFGYTIFGLTDLSSCTGLETVTVKAPCTIDFQTLRASKNLPKSFLLKIGLSESFTDNLPKLYKDSILYPVFLSHSGKNKPFARKLYDALIAKGVIVYFDEKELKPGDHVLEQLTKGIEYFDKMVLICSKESLSENWWVDREIDRLLSKEKQLMEERGQQIHLLIPITIDNYVFEWNGAKKEEIKRYNIGDFCDWENDEKFELALAKLIESLIVNRLDIKPKSLL